MLWRNGKPLNEPGLDRGLQFGDGHFTTLTIEQGQPRWWNAHWQRLRTASERLAMGLPDETSVLSTLRQIPLRDAVVKIIITRGTGGRGYGFAAATPVNWYLSATALAPRDNTAIKAQHAELQLARSAQFAGLKTLNRLEQVMLSHERQQRGCAELLVSDTQGYLVEAVSSNLFWREENQWYTPDLSQCGISGIVREQILSAKVLGEVAQVAVAPERLLRAEQALLTNTVLGLRPLAQIGEHKLHDSTLPKALVSWWPLSDA
ncbi:aminodeoxychorismate lyase [Pseudidiomarina insulisalsae]|uniref:Aminodeoxychorismate lyase n=1 Tax=Pseudidiomarina insulisalsae TaxID=575789 RepID=A0A432YHE0_9GAMM|nr:aminodeoxychorismate lyase [Pseudidiomarina insulisalsae]RUO60354.1 aminodeoxychorismate lyase [Pseudidiomarina insulisalsae]